MDFTSSLSASENNNYLPPVKHEWRFNGTPIIGQLPGFVVRPRQAVNSTYGPFTIGKTQWKLKLRIPSFFVILKRVNGGENDECLSFRLNANLGNLNCSGSFTFTSENREQYVGQFVKPALMSFFNRLCFTFEALVRPENYLGGLPCDFLFVVIDKSDDEGVRKERKKLAEFAAHRSILKKRSPVFRTMLQEGSPFEEARTGVIRIGHFSPETVKSLLQFVYIKNENVVDGKQYPEAIELLDAAEQYQLAELKKHCGHRLVALIDCQNALDLLSTADLYRLGELKHGVMRFIRNNRRRIILRPDPNNSEALNRLPRETLVELLRFFSELHDPI